MKTITEEDTFKALKKSTFLQVYKDRIAGYSYGPMDNGFYEKHGWTRKEFMDEMERQIYHLKQESQPKNPV